MAEEVIGIFGITCGKYVTPMNCCQLRYMRGTSWKQRQNTSVNQIVDSVQICQSYCSSDHHKILFRSEYSMWLNSPSPVVNKCMIIYRNCFQLWFKIMREDLDVLGLTSDLLTNLFQTGMLRPLLFFELQYIDIYKRRIKKMKTNNIFLLLLFS